MSGTTRATWSEVRGDERDDAMVQEIFHRLCPLLAAGEPLRAIAIARRVAELVIETGHEGDVDAYGLPDLVPLREEDVRSLEGCALLLYHRAREALQPPLGMPRPEERRLYAAAEEIAGAQALAMLARLRAEIGRGVPGRTDTTEEGAR